MIDHSYLEKVLSDITSQELELDEKEIVLCNVFKEISTDGISCINSSAISRLVEELIKHSMAKSLIKLWKLFSKNLGDSFTECSPSFIFQSFIKKISQFGDLDASKTLKVNKIFTKISNHISTNLSSKDSENIFMHNSYASHIICTFLSSSGNVSVPDNITRGKYTTKYREAFNLKDDFLFKVKTQGNKELEEICINLMVRIIDLDDFKEFCMSANSSRIIQTMLHIASTHHAKSNSDFSIIYIKIFQKWAESFGTIIENVKPLKKKKIKKMDIVYDPLSYEDPYVSSVTQAILKTVPVCSNLPKIDSYGLDSLFGTIKIQESALHPIANYVVQTYLTHFLICNKLVNNKTFDITISKLIEHIDQIINSKHYGVLVAMATCLSHQRVENNVGDDENHIHNFQESFLKALHTHFVSNEIMKPLEVDVSDQPNFELLNSTLFFKLAFLGTPLNSFSRESFTSKKLPVSLHGSLLIQTLLGSADSETNNCFDRALVWHHLIEPLFSRLDSRTWKFLIISLFTNDKGSRILDSLLDWFKSDSIKEYREKFYFEIMGQLAHEMCLDRFGSWVFDHLWRCCLALSRYDWLEGLGKGLLLRGSSLQGNFYGKHIWNNYNLSLLKSNPIKWRKFCLQSYDNSKGKLKRKIDKT